MCRESESEPLGCFHVMKYNRKCYSWRSLNLAVWPQTTVLADLNLTVLPYVYAHSRNFGRF